MAGVRADCGSQLLCSRRDRVDVISLPEEQVDGVERDVVPEAWGRVDGDESALGSAVEGVARRQVAVWRAVGGTLSASRDASFRPRSYSSSGITSRSSGWRR